MEQQVMFAAKPCPLWDCVEDAQRAIEVYPERFPAGYCYVVEPVRMSSDRGVTIMEMARIEARHPCGVLCGYVPKFTGE